MNGFIRRFSSLVYKETLQVLRDPSTILLGVVLPILLIILIGSGVTLDVKHVPIAVVMERQDSMTQSVYDSLYGSEYFQPIAVRDRKTAELLMEKRKVDAILVIPQDFSDQIMRGQGKVQGIYYGVDTSVAMSIESYVNSAINLWAVKNIPFMLRGGYITMNPRMWFNVMAREWERGTFEALFVTPVKPIEIILAKVVPYYVLAMLGLLFCLGVSYFFYEVPMRGSLWIICIVSTLYLIVSLNMGLLFYLIHIHNLW
ncbi:MAG: ABC transporter permease [Veillonella sp.]|nr:ABC transporter permease [Veillonella sp.]